MGADPIHSAASANRTGGSRRLKASDIAKGAFVYTPDGNRLGRIERVMVDETTGEPDHAVVSFMFGNSMGIRADEHPVPWPLLTYNSRFSGYELRITGGQALRSDR
jgi:sporulation protein YlmC with PRC-barrel domain